MYAVLYTWLPGYQWCTHARMCSEVHTHTHARTHARARAHTIWLHWIARKGKTNQCCTLWWSATIRLTKESINEMYGSGPNKGQSFQPKIYNNPMFGGTFAIPHPSCVALVAHWTMSPSKRGVIPACCLQVPAHPFHREVVWFR